MGQQQLLLIILGVIIAGLAVVIGIQLFTVNERVAQIEIMVTEGTSFATLAQQYYKKPATIGGGGSSFTGWEFPRAYPVISTDGQSCSTAVADYEADYSNPNKLVINAMNWDYQTSFPGSINIMFTITPTDIHTQISAAGGPW